MASEMYITLLKSCLEQARTAGSVYHTEFERIYRETLCSFDMTTFISSGGYINLSTKVQALSTACREISTRLAEQATRVDSQQSALLLSYSTTLWNPILAAQLDSLKKPPTSMGKSASSSKSAAPGHHGPRTTAIPPGTSRSTSTSVDPKHVADAMSVMIEENQQLFPKTRTGCGTPSCDRCLSLFQTLPLTLCTSHGGMSCNPTGWHPHLTQALWAKLAGIHNCRAKEWQWHAPTLREGQIQNPMLVSGLEDDMLSLSTSEVVVSEAEVSTAPQNSAAPDRWADSEPINRPISPTYALTDTPPNDQNAMSVRRPAGKRKVNRSTSRDHKGRKGPKR